MRSVLDQSKTTLVAQGSKGFQGRRVTSVMHRTNRFRPWRYPRCDVFGVDSKIVLTLDVGKHRDCSAVPRSTGGSYKGDRRHYHLVAGRDPGGQVGQVQRCRTARKRDRVAHAQVFCKGLLELGGPGAHRKPAGPERHLDGGDLGVAEAHVEERDERLLQSY